MSEQPKTNQIPAVQMLPNPHVRSTLPEEEGRLSTLDMGALQAEFETWQNGDGTSVTQMGHAVVKLAKEARENTTDERSGLLNPRGLELWFERNQPEQFAFIMCDGRGFGDINKDYGHEVGHRVIKFMGDVITSKLRIDNNTERDENNEKRKIEHRDAASIARTADDVEGSASARWGGDEFIVIADLTGLDQDGIDTALESISSRLDDFGTYKEPENNISIPVSVRMASVVGTKNDGKSFSDYQHEVDEKLKIVTQEEKRLKAM